MTQSYNLIYSSVHGNALGVVVEPRTEATLSTEERKATWEVRIGPLVVDAATNAPYPESEYSSVIEDLRQFCEQAGIQAW